MFARELLLEFIAAAYFARVCREGPCPRGICWTCRQCKAAYDLSDEAWQ